MFTDLLRRSRGLVIALVVLVFTAGIAFAAAPQLRPAGHDVPTVAGEPAGVADPDQDEDEEADATRGPEVETPDAGDADEADEADEAVEESASTEEAPYGEGSHAPLEDGSQPDGFPIKGNEDSMLYHTTESPYYGRTVAEVWFRDVATAEAAGFNRWDSGKSQRGKK